eukprot:gnl/MRDRNA2_/MRDRNA2_18021_c0_seq1.p1 gnl/MRDRNA2_/MRDRNA2_18021_c0~~gnl/MRDRNA2_/MRDRNA2_18021_c0_seq1.p1  ORF type:complete len:487 (+),score=77.18 gnl/MRDRNA2_/MRDRNA2_18021_c0_seq1:118-1578(+)
MPGQPNTRDGKEKSGPSITRSSMCTIQLDSSKSDLPFEMQVFLDEVQSEMLAILVDSLPHAVRLCAKVCVERFAHRFDTSFTSMRTPDVLRPHAKPEPACPTPLLSGTVQPETESEDAQVPCADAESSWTQLTTTSSVKEPELECSKPTISMESDQPESPSSRANRLSVQLPLGHVAAIKARLFENHAPKESPATHVPDDCVAVLESEAKGQRPATEDHHLKGQAYSEQSWKESLADAPFDFLVSSQSQFPVPPPPSPKLSSRTWEEKQNTLSGEEASLEPMSAESETERSETDLFLLGSGSEKESEICTKRNFPSSFLDRMLGTLTRSAALTSVSGSQPVPLQGPTLVMRSADRWSTRSMNVHYTLDSEVMHWSQWGYDLQCVLPEGAMDVEVSFTAGGAEIYAVDRDAKGKPWVEPIEGGYTVERFFYTAPAADFKVTFTLRGPLRNCYVDEEEVEGIEDLSDTCQSTSAGAPSVCHFSPHNVT